MIHKRKKKRRETPLLPHILRLSASSNYLAEEIRKRLDRLEYDIHRQNDCIDQKLEEMLTAAAGGNSDLTLGNMQQSLEKNTTMLKRLCAKICVLEAELEKLKQNSVPHNATSELEHRINKIKKEVCI